MSSIQDLELFPIYFFSFLSSNTLSYGLRRILTVPVGVTIALARDKRTAKAAIEDGLMPRPIE